MTVALTPSEVSADQTRGPQGGWLIHFKMGSSEAPTQVCVRLKNGRPQPAPLARAARQGCEVFFGGILYDQQELSRSLGDQTTPASGPAELVLQAYLRWGEDSLRRFKGIFSLIIWDRIRQRLLCVRDPMGHYPLFYAEGGGAIYLSTSVETLLQQSHVKRSVDRIALANHLRHQWFDREQTFFEGVRRVPAGHVLWIGASSRGQHRYWDPVPSGQRMDWIPEEEALERFDAMLDRTLNRYQELGPTGVFLSGGLDSVSVAAAALDNSKRHEMPTPWALSIAFPEDVDETPIQTGVARGLGMPQILTPFAEAAGTEGFLVTMLRTSAGLESPLLSPWLAVYEYLARQGRDRGCRVILTGGGGDEWLGVSPFLAADLIRTGQFRSWLRLYRALGSSFNVSAATTFRSLMWTCGLKRLLHDGARDFLGKVAPGYLASRHLKRVQHAIPAWLAPDPALRAELQRRDCLPWTADTQSDSYYLRELRPALDHQLVSLECEELFESGRREHLWYLRPYWDAELVEVLCRIPPQSLINGGRTKGLVRQSLARRFPNLGFERQRKVQASNFLTSLVTQDAAQAWRELRDLHALSELGVVDGKAVKSELEQVMRGESVSDGSRLWFFLNLEVWLRAHL